MATGSTGTEIWITSDTHYNHKNMCRGVSDWYLRDPNRFIESTRDFQTLQEMNNALVNNINNVVGQYDILIHLGDWSFGGFDSIREFYDRLICKQIYLIVGNHDKHVKKNLFDIREIFLGGVDKENDEYMFNKHILHLTHYPLTSWNKIRRGSIHLHGHTHFKADNRFGKGRKMDVGIDGHPEFRPYNLRTEIISMMIKRSILSEYGINEDHHIDIIEV